MTVSAADVAQLRLMVNEPMTANYSDVALRELIERFPLMDERGEEPYTFSQLSGGSPARVANPVWMAGYDLNAAAAEVWGYKAGVLSASFDFSADGGKFAESQAFKHCQERERYFRMRRAPKSVRVFPVKDSTAEERFPWIGNLAEGD